MSKNNLVLRCIDDLLKEDFFIPDYQRGYRWTSIQVKALLDDIWKFRSDSQESPKDAFYCLQPIVVAPSDEGWIVIDGQQRLTTIHLVLTFLSPFLLTRERKNFGLSYATRPKSEAFLTNPNMKFADENVDYFHICEAYRTIEEWFKSMPGNASFNFITTLLNSDEEGKNVKVIWYEVIAGSSKEHIDVFTRLNIGKIPLTNGELIKAIFLRKSNFTEDRATLKQIQIASEWDYIERTLQQDEFWYFIYNTSNPISYDNRIEFILDLIYNKSKNDEYHHTFFEFMKDTKEEAVQTESGAFDADALWLKIKRYFLTLEEWYQDQEMYHLIGFLVSCGYGVDQLIRDKENETKDNFKRHLQKLIKNEVNYDIEDLEYGSNKSKNKIKKVLLLFNIQTLLTSTGADIRFPFHRYKRENWDIEHIRSQTEKPVKGDKQQKEWISDIVDYFTGKPIKTLIEDEEDGLSSLSEEVKKICNRLIKVYSSDEIEEGAFDEMRQEIEKYFREHSPEGASETENIDGIGNLALLDETTNRSYKNALFAIKRKKIIENDAIGKFVPICTKNVFLKYYSYQFDEVMFWKNEDAKAYLSAIKNTLKDYLPTNPIK